MLDDLTFARLRVRFRVLRDFRLPAYPGSALRGAWGYALRRVRYDSRRSRCRACPLRFHCQSSRLGQYLFESPADHPFFFERPRYLRYELRRFPPPYVLEPPPGGTYRPGKFMEVAWVLVGKAIGCLPLLVCSWIGMEQALLGGTSGTVRLEEVLSLDPLENASPAEVLFDGPGKEASGSIQVADWPLIRERAAAWRVQAGEVAEIQLRFLTPVRLKNENRLGEIPDFRLLMRTLLRRITLLSVHSPLAEPIDHERLLEASTAVATAASDLRWKDWERYSSRQRQVMRLGGYVGRITYQGPLEEFLPYLLLGSQVHIGKQATFGLGRYRLHDPA